MNWASVLGQPLAVRLLQHAVAHGKAAHAYLFVGPDGVGKRTVARVMASAMTCADRSLSGDPCGQCPSCQKVAASPILHPDIHYIEPEGRLIKTDQIRTLQAEMYARPTQGLFRIAILDGVDRLNAEAGNRILKLLEEPPPFALFILLTNNTAGVLPTIVSRCQSVHFVPLHPEVMETALQQRRVDSLKASVFARITGGSLGKAVILLDDAAALKRREEALETLEALGHLDDFEILATAETLDKHRDHLDEWMEWTLLWLRDALLVTQGTGARLVMNRDQLPRVERVGRAIGQHRLIAMLGMIVDARQRMQRNANSRLSLDVLLLQLSAVGRESAVN